MILDDHEIRRRKATSARIDMVCQMWPAQARLRDADKRLDALRAAYKKATDDDERERLSDLTCECFEEMGDLIDLISDQIGDY
jgi:hypothetical protein